jgi:hypothetical protein
MQGRQEKLERLDCAYDLSSLSGEVEAVGRGNRSMQQCPPARRRRRPHPRLVFCDRVLVTLVILRFQLPHQALAVLFGVDRATVTRAVGEVRSLLGARGFAVPGLRGAAAHLGRRVRLRRRPRGRTAHRRHRDPGPPAQGHPARPAGVCVRQAQAEHDQDHHHLRRSGPHPVGGGGATGPDARPDRRQDRGNRGAAAVLPDRHGQGGHRLPGACQGISRSGLRPATQAAQGRPGRADRAYKQARTRQSSRRICVEHAIAEHKQWRPLQRYIGRREAYAQTHLATAGLVSDRAARR